jgi:hypothetical protein
MRFYKLDPEVAGGWGPNTVFSRTPGQPLVIHKFHYQFDGWLGDELLESDPCFIVTQRLAEAIRNAGLSGYVLRPVETSTSEQFQEIYPNRQIPIFEWLEITGKAGVDDWGVDVDGRLVVSSEALAVIKSTTLNHCEVSEFTKSSV